MEQAQPRVEDKHDVSAKDKQLPPFPVISDGFSAVTKLSCLHMASDPAADIWAGADPSEGIRIRPVSSLLAHSVSNRPMCLNVKVSSQSGVRKGRTKAARGRASRAPGTKTRVSKEKSSNLTTSQANNSNDDSDSPMPSPSNGIALRLRPRRPRPVQPVVDASDPSDSKDDSDSNHIIRDGRHED